MRSTELVLDLHQLYRLACLSKWLRILSPARGRALAAPSPPFAAFASRMPRGGSPGHPRRAHGPLAGATRSLSCTAAFPIRSIGLAFLCSFHARHVSCGVIRDQMAKYDEARVPRGTSRRWEVLMSDDGAGLQAGINRRTAKDVRAEHRVLLSFSDRDLSAMPLVPEGTRLARASWYMDLHNPAKADFPATGDETVEPGQHVLARKEVSAELWDELRRACDDVLGRPSMRRLRPAV